MIYIAIINHSYEENTMKKDERLFVVGGLSPDYSGKIKEFRYVSIDMSSGGYPFAGNFWDAEKYESLEKAVSRGISDAAMCKIEKPQVFEIELVPVDISLMAKTHKKVDDVIKNLSKEELAILKERLK
jgi:hypothetical protein